MDIWTKDIPVEPIEPPVSRCQKCESAGQMELPHYRNGLMPIPPVSGRHSRGRVGNGDEAQGPMLLLFVRGDLDLVGLV